MHNQLTVDAFKHAWDKYTVDLYSDKKVNEKKWADSDYSVISLLSLF